MMQSMTAFTRHESHGEWGSSVWEIRSVNHRYLEIFLRLPENFSFLETKVRELVRSQLHRGKIEILLRYEGPQSLSKQWNINQDFACQLIEACQQISCLSPGSFQALDPLEVLNWPGVITSNKVNQESEQEFLTQFTAALIDLSEQRKREGRYIQEFFLQQLTLMTHEIEKVQNFAAGILQAQREKIVNRFTELKLSMDPSRLEQEIVFLAHKTDITEELERLFMHVQELKNIVHSGQSAGRRMDFLMQELNREANTLASKSINIETTKAAVELKVLIEQMREQIQNVE